jgi:hypothetical protein
MSLDIDLAVLSDRRDMCCYALLFFASCRIGHFSPKSGRPKHISLGSIWSAAVTSDGG